MEENDFGSRIAELTNFFAVYLFFCDINSILSFTVMFSKFLIVGTYNGTNINPSAHIPNVIRR